METPSDENVSKDKIARQRHGNIRWMQSHTIMNTSTHKTNVFQVVGPASVTRRPEVQSKWSNTYPCSASNYTSKWRQCPYYQNQKLVLL